MKINIIAFAAIFSLLTAFSPQSPVYAADNGSGTSNSDSSATKALPEKEIKDPVEKARKNALTKRYVSILSKLDTKEAQHFMIIVTNYNMISTVNAVEEDVMQAAKACKENNKDMVDAIDEHKKKWEDALKAPRQEAKANINNLILAQSYLPKEQFHSLFNLIDETRRYNSSRFEKTPVTTPEACEFMLSKMEETQSNMVSMLKATLASYPSARSKSQP